MGASLSIPVTARMQQDTAARRKAPHGPKFGKTSLLFVGRFSSIPVESVSSAASYQQRRSTIEAYRQGPALTLRASKRVSVTSTRRQSSRFATGPSPQATLASAGILPFRAEPVSLMSISRDLTLQPYKAKPGSIIDAILACSLTRSSEQPARASEWIVPCRAKPASIMSISTDLTLQGQAIKRHKHQGSYLSGPSQQAS